jgi:hypothetical protein
MQVTLKARTPLTENVQKYKETFGHLPAITKTGTRMDDLYQQTSTKGKPTYEDFFQGLRDEGLTQSQLTDLRNSLPPIVTIKSQTPKRKQ